MTQDKLNKNVQDALSRVGQDGFDKCFIDRLVGVVQNGPCVVDSFVFCLTNADTRKMLEFSPNANAELGVPALPRRLLGQPLNSELVLLQGRLWRVTQSIHPGYL